MWFVVEFDPAKLSWKSFRAEILGATDPTKAQGGSIRAQMLEHWQALGLSEKPDTLNNCVHASAGPLEGLRERMTWAGVALTDDPLGRLLLSSGVPQATIEAWMDNPLVGPWPAGHQAETMSGPVFDCTEDTDTLALRDAAVEYLKSAGLEPWSMVPLSQQGGGGSQAQDLQAEKARMGALQSGNSELPSKMTILHFNDVYNVEPRKKEPVGGIARFVTRMRELKDESVKRGEYEAVCLFSGDAFNPSITSTSTKGEHMVPALNAIGIHTACYGNHDFDFGLEKLVKLKSATNFPWLISNVMDKKSGRPLAEGIGTRMLDFHGRKIGLIGLVEKEWLVTLATIDPSEVDYEDFCPCGRRLAKMLKEKQGAELVIAITHMRVPNDELLAHEAPEIDIILGGHDHHYDVKPVGPYGTYVLKSGTDFRDITVLQLEFSKDPAGRPFKVLQHDHVEITAGIAEDPEMKAFVDKCEAKVKDEMEKTLGEIAVDLDCRFASVRTMETNAGNLVTDVMRRSLKADIGFLNSGTMRADAIIETGPFKMRDLVNLLPMLDELCLLQLTGEQLLNVLENSVSQYPRLEGRFAQVSGVTFTFDAAKPGGERVVDGSVKVCGEPLDLAKPYKLCTKDYLRQGKDGYDVFRDTLCLADGEQAGILPTMLREFFQELQTLNGVSEDADQHSANLANKMLKEVKSITKIGDGPDLMKRYAVNPAVEGRVVCLNPVAA
jgi:5'-nucleotidase